jgi:hypothetical protein
VKNSLRKAYIRRFGTSGMFEQDDGENWTQCSASSRGVLSRKLTFHHAMDLGHDERYHEDMPGAVTQGLSEQNQRGFYHRWTAMMSGDYRLPPAPHANGARRENGRAAPSVRRGRGEEAGAATTAEATTRV